MKNTLKRLLPLTVRSLIFKVGSEVNWIMHHRSTINNFHECFSGKKIALIGSSPSLTGQMAGLEIDQYDVCIRVNFPRNRGMESDRGSRTDFIYAGANFEFVPRDWLQESGWQNAILVTSVNNKRYFQDISCAEKKIYLPISFNLKTIKRASKCLSFDYRQLGGMPRSGVMFVLFLLLYSRKAKITLYGFSTDSVSALSTISPLSEVMLYDTAKLLNAHCEPHAEIELLKYIWSAGLINWYEMGISRNDSG
jgi:hypothetical protein